MDGVAVLDDALGLAVVLADDPAVAGRVVDDARQQRRRVAVGDVRLDEFGERLGPQQRGVAGEHDDDRVVVVVVVAGEGGHPDRRGVTGAVLFDLFDEGDVGPGRRELLDLLRHLLGAMADDEGRPLGSEELESVDDVEHHRPPADQVEGLRAGGSHARSFTCCKDDRRYCHCSGERNRTPVLGTKNRCLTVRRPRTVARRHRIRGWRVLRRPITWRPLWVR